VRWLDPPDDDRTVHHDVRLDHLVGVIDLVLGIVERIGDRFRVGRRAERHTGQDG
jgi:hypothetical protein